MNTSPKISAVFFAALLLLGSAGRVDALTIYAVDTSNNLLRFDSATPNTVQTTAITGLQPNETIQGIDFYPVNTGLYALASSSRLYSINTVSAVATPVGAPGAF